MATCSCACACWLLELCCRQRCHKENKHSRIGECGGHNHVFAAVPRKATGGSKSSAAAAQAQPEWCTQRTSLATQLPQLGVCDAEQNVAAFSPRHEEFGAACHFCLAGTQWRAQVRAEQQRRLQRSFAACSLRTTRTPTHCRCTFPLPPHTCTTFRRYTLPCEVRVCRGARDSWAADKSTFWAKHPSPIDPSPPSPPAAKTPCVQCARRGQGQVLGEE
jgi:hypothetical protein